MWISGEYMQPCKDTVPRSPYVDGQVDVCACPVIGTTKALKTSQRKVANRLAWANQHGADIVVLVATHASTTDGELCYQDDHREGFSSQTAPDVSRIHFLSPHDPLAAYICLSVFRDLSRRVVPDRLRGNVGLPWTLSCRLWATHINGERVRLLPQPGSTVRLWPLGNIRPRPYLFTQGCY